MIVLVQRWNFHNPDPSRLHGKSIAFVPVNVFKMWSLSRVEQLALPRWPGVVHYAFLLKQYPLEHDRKAAKNWSNNFSLVQPYLYKLIDTIPVGFNVLNCHLRLLLLFKEGPHKKETTHLFRCEANTLMATKDQSKTLPMSVFFWKGFFFLHHSCHRDCESGQLIYEKV